MARLNDPPVPLTESVDALKRRFIRQNREIARVNSTQSQRIRNLETEISRLLAENIALREQAIAAAAEAEKWRTASRIGKDVIELKSRLESKLSEVNALVEELGTIPEKAARRSSVRRRKSVYASEVAVSPNERDWRTRQTIGGVLAGERDGQDGKLPAIMEDKYYPRRTLETEELRILTSAANIHNEDTESPDLGPPPIAHFEVADPITFDAAKSPKRVSGGMITSEDSIAPLSRNLDIRRKRRTSSLIHDMPSLQDESEESNLGNNVETTSQQKSVAKRKFEASEMEIENARTIPNDGFEFSRKESAPTNRPKPSRFMSQPAKKTQESQQIEQTISPQKLQARRVLSQKSTNSPAKRVIGNTFDQKDILKPADVSPIKPSHRRIMPSNSRNSLRIDPSQAQEFTDDPTTAPKTPAPTLEELISPPQSAMDTDSKPKSIEAAITNSVEDVLNGSIGRASRRTKSAVSYAEPNLRDKMRRPDKKLVGAVEGIGKVGTTSDRESSRDMSREKSTDPGSARIIKVKPEKRLNEDEGWKNLPDANDNNDKQEPASPLQNREKSTIPKPSEVRKKRTFSESEGTKSRQNTSVIEAEHTLDKAVSRLSIYDPPTSSPVSKSVEDKDVAIAQPSPERNPSNNNTRRAIDRPSSALSTTTTRSRRFSVQPSSDPSTVPTGTGSATGTGTNTSTSTNTATVPTAQRPSSALSSRDLGGKENISLVPSKLKRASSVQGISQSTSSTTTQNRIASTSTGERSLGARRRSMMV